MAATAVCLGLGLAALAATFRGGGESGFRSDEELARAVLLALEGEDRARLERFLVTRHEHRDPLWGHLPESHYFTFEYARRLNERSTRKALARALERYGGRPLRFVRLEYREAPEVYPGFTLHRRAALWVRDRGTGAEGAIPVLDVLLERDGRWKAMNYEE